MKYKQGQALAFKIFPIHPRHGKLHSTSIFCYWPIADSGFTPAAVTELQQVQGKLVEPKELDTVLGHLE